MSYYVYIHKCPNEKVYIGTTTMDPIKRWGSNGIRYKSNKHFYSAIQKYGWNNISHKVIEIETRNEMFYLEKYLITYYQSSKKEFGYNKSSGGEGGPTGCHLSIETKRKLSESLKGRAAWNKGCHLSTETKHKMSEVKKGIPKSEETKRKLSESLKGRTSPTKGMHWNLTEETKHKISESHKGKCHSAETKHKMSESRKKYIKSKNSKICTPSILAK